MSSWNEAYTSAYLPNLGNLIGDRDLKQWFVAREVGIDESVLSLWVVGKRRVPAYRLVPLAEVLGLSLAELLIQGSGEGPAVPEPEPAAPEPVVAPDKPWRVLFGTLDPLLMGYRKPRVCWRRDCPVHLEAAG